jgi:PAS domain S-box-containing protein
MSSGRDCSEIIDLLDDCIIIRELGGRVTGWNRAAEKLYGISREQALGAPMEALFEPAADEAQQQAHDHLAVVSDWSGTVNRVTRGALKSVLVSVMVKVQRDDAGQPVALFETSHPVVCARGPVPNDGLGRLLDAAGIVVVPIDVTAVAKSLAALGADHRMNLRDYLKTEPQLVRQMMRSARVAAMEPSGQALSPAAKAAFGPVGRELSSFWPEENAEVFVDTILSVLAGAGYARGSCQLMGSDGETFDAEVTVVPASPDADHAFVLLSVRDVSVEREAFAELKSSELRYKHVFDHLPIALAEIDASGLADMFRELRQQGVTDLSPYLDEHPEFLDAALRAMKVVQSNPTHVQMMAGEREEDILGDLTPYWDLGMPVLRKSFEARYRGEEFFQSEVTLRCLDGSTVQVLFATARHGYLQDRAVCSFIDFTERNIAEQALRRSERRYQDLFQAMTVSFWELDLTIINDLLQENGLAADGDIVDYLRNYPDCVARILSATTIVDVNDQTLILFGGRQKSDLLGTLDHFWSPDRWLDGAAAVLNVLVHDASVTIETRLRRLDGSEFDAQFTLWFSADDRRRGLAAVTDISERVNAFNALEHSEQRFRDLFQHLPLPVFQIRSARLLGVLQDLKDEGVPDLNAHLAEHPDFLWHAMENTVVEQANDAALKLLGATHHDELKGGSVAPFFGNHPEIYARLLQNRYQSLETYDEEISLTTLDGRVREGTLTVTFPPAMAKLGVTISAFIDTTEKKQAERRLRHIEAEYAHAARISMLGELTASIAHEVNQPLAAITTYGEAGLRWLNRPNPELSEVRDIVTRIVADAQRAASVIARVRNMASHRMQDEEIVSLDELVAEAVLFLRHEFQSHKVNVVHLPSSGPARVTVDRIQLQQVIVNMAVNAIQAISATQCERREVVLRTTEEGAQVCCSVEDSGPGIPVEGTARIFESFFTTKNGGMGMGLPISRSIIEAHGGKMSADNDSRLGGARFSFVLPASQ